MPADPTIAADNPDATLAHEPDLHPAVLRFCDAARQQFADRLERIVLYGSRARGDHRPDSDYDIAIFVRDLDNAYVEYKPLAGLMMQILADDDIEINADLHAAGIWRTSPVPLMRNIRHEGIDL